MGHVHIGLFLITLVSAGVRTGGGGGGSGPLFCHFFWSPHIMYQFTRVFSKAIKQLQLPYSSGYKSHSFRIEACTDLAVIGLSTDDIQKSGRWKSSSYISYIRMPNI